MGCLQKHLYGVFDLPLPRNAQKRTKKKTKGKKGRMVGGWVRDLANVVSRGGSVDFVLVAPRSRNNEQAANREYKYKQLIVADNLLGVIGPVSCVIGSGTAHYLVSAVAVAQLAVTCCRWCKQNAAK
jgi:hypothetical protein